MPHGVLKKREREGEQWLQQERTGYFWTGSPKTGWEEDGGGRSDRTVGGLPFHPQEPELGLVGDVDPCGQGSDVR